MQDVSVKGLERTLGKAVDAAAKVAAANAGAAAAASPPPPPIPATDEPKGSGK